MNMSNGFVELSIDEQTNVDGGFWGAVAATFVICVGLDIGNEVLKNKTGRDIGDWTAYGVGYAIDKAGQGLEYVGKHIA